MGVRVVTGLASLRLYVLDQIFWPADAGTHSIAYALLPSARLFFLISLY